MHIKEIITESTEHSEKFYNVREWLKAAKKLKLHVTSSGMAGALHKSAKIYYADGESGGGYFYLYSPNNGEGQLTVDSEITEMTMRGPDLPSQAEQFATKYKDRWLTHGKHIADIENYKVLQDGIYYSLWDEDTLVACCSLTNSNNEIDDVYVASAYRGKKIFSMMLWFFKTRLNRSPLMIGSVHSKIMQEVVKGLSRFNKYWYNISTNEKQPFSVETIDDYYSYLQPTKWRLMLENDGEFNWPMHNNGGFMKEAYEPYIS